MSDNNGLFELAREIAANMGFEWAYATEQPLDHRAYVSGPDGASISITACGTYNRKGRLEIDGDWPRPVRGRGFYSFYPREQPSITVSATKPPRTIARDILRRFVPKYLPLYREMAERRRNHIAHMARIESLTAQLCERINLQPDERNGGARFGYNGPHLPSGQAEVRLYDDIPVVDFNIRSVPFEIARQIVVLLEQATLAN